MKAKRQWKRAAGILIASLLLLGACAVPGPPVPADRHRLTVVAADDAAGIPAFVIADAQQSCNRIGTPRARKTGDGKVDVWVAPDRPTIYSRTERFETPKGAYTNLICRVHFSETPAGHITMGKNVGLIAVVTFDSRGLPILYTTLHTCGCYLAFVPTAYLPAAALPDGWDKGRQTVYSENLPGLLDFQGDAPGSNRVMILLKSGSHRVEDIRLADAASPLPEPVKTADVLPLASLDRLPLENGGTTSFFETRGCRKGYVKGSEKIWERLLISWWALDWRVGEDKRLAGRGEAGPVFYTSLMPWDRKASDMRHFAAFLTYWGWRL